MVEHLLANGADLKRLNGWKEGAIDLAASAGYWDLVALLRNRWQSLSLPPSLTHSLTPSLSRALSLSERESARAHTHMCVCVCVCVHACMRACVFALDELILTLDRVLTEVQRSSPSAPAGLRAR